MAIGWVQICLAALCVCNVASWDGVSVLLEEKPGGDALTRAKAIRKEAENRLEAAENAAPSLDDPWSPNAASQQVMEEKARAHAAFDAAKAQEKIAAEQEADDLLKSVAPEDTTSGQVKAQLKPVLTDKTYRSVPYEVNAAEYSGSTDPQMPKSEMEAAKFSEELNTIETASTRQTSPMDVSDTAGADDATTSTSYMQSYDDTMREIKLKSLKKASMKRSLDQAILLKAKAISDEKKSALGAEEEKVNYLKAKVSEAEKAVRDAKSAQSSGQLDSKVAGEMVTEAEDNLRHVTKQMNSERSTLRHMEVKKAEHQAGGSPEHADERKKEMKKAAMKAYQKRAAIEFVQDEFERREKAKQSKKMMAAERLRKGKRADILKVKQLEANEAKQKTEQNSKAGIEKARLKEAEDANECQVSEWSSYSRCSKSCGGGMMSSFRTVLKANGKKDCPALAKGKPCNQQPCAKPEHYLSDKDDQITKTMADGTKVLTTASKEQESAAGDCEPALSSCADAQAKTKICDSFKLKPKKQPSAVDMIKATEFKTPDPTFEGDAHDPELSVSNVVANLPGSDEVQELGAGAAHHARALLTLDPGQEEFCKQAKVQEAEHCEKAKECSNSQSVDSANEVGESATDDDSEEAHFDSALKHLLQGVDHLRHLPV